MSSQREESSDAPRQLENGSNTFICALGLRERRKVGVREVWLAVSCFELMMCAQNREEKLP